MSTPIEDPIAALFPGFETGLFEVPRGEIFYRTAGDGPPVVLIHGYPQTHACWHHIAPQLVERFTVVLPDLRGYGRSTHSFDDPVSRLSAPSNTQDTPHHPHVGLPQPDVTPFSKRALAKDILALMTHLGHGAFRVVGHDRGARVGYRLALDHPDAVVALSLLDILPTSTTWDAMTAELAISSYHWPFLAQPYPLAETLIAGAPEFYTQHTLRSWTGEKTLKPFHPLALQDYQSVLATHMGRRSVADDYRAGATIDRDIDLADQAEGRKIICPTQVLWGSEYVGKSKDADPLAVWRQWCETAEGHALASGHFLAEEQPEQTAALLLEFLERSL